MHIVTIANKRSQSGSFSCDPNGKNSSPDAQLAKRKSFMSILHHSVDFQSLDFDHLMDTTFSLHDERHSEEKEVNQKPSGVEAIVTDSKDDANAGIEASERNNKNEGSVFKTDDIWNREIKRSHSVKTGDEEMELGRKKCIYQKEMSEGFDIEIANAGHKEVIAEGSSNHSTKHFDLKAKNTSVDQDRRLFIYFYFLLGFTVVSFVGVMAHVHSRWSS
ncbi:unnamed protein product [Cylindrotheca closterium]|uniref:Uncharacterized protein n=1 Tax=Cylindrotheca closterium TaxID=2856 RepID=A0AAD2FT02_9STRA|nr:unnamed protein product [Cylindrotheca closterium]